MIVDDADDEMKLQIGPVDVRAASDEAARLRARLTSGGRFGGGGNGMSSSGAFVRSQDGAKPNRPGPFETRFAV